MQLEAAVEEEMEIYIEMWKETLAELEDNIAILQVCTICSFIYQSLLLENVFGYFALGSLHFSFAK